MEQRSSKFGKDAYNDEEVDDVFLPNSLPEKNIEDNPLYMHYCGESCKIDCRKIKLKKVRFADEVQAENEEKNEGDKATKSEEELTAERKKKMEKMFQECHRKALNDNEILDMLTEEGKNMIQKLHLGQCDEEAFHAFERIEEEGNDFLDICEPKNNGCPCYGCN